MLLAGCQGPEQDGGAASKEAFDWPFEGRLAWPRDRDLWVADSARKQPRKITQLPREARVTGAAWSPDGQRLVYAHFMRGPGRDATGADLWVVDADGGNARVFVERDAPSTVLTAPMWAPSGRVYYTALRLQDDTRQPSILRKSEGSAPEEVVEGGYIAGVLPDESAIVYPRSGPAGASLWKQPLGQGGAGCELLSEGVFESLGQPRVSPDGTRVAFPAVGEPTAATGTCGKATSISSRSAPTAANPPAAEPPAVLRLAKWLTLAPDTAWAHGLPWDIWVMHLDGSGLTKVAALQEDDPFVAWSPDGAHLAAFGAGALNVVEVSSGQVRKVAVGGSGTLDWVP